MKKYKKYSLLLVLLSVLLLNVKAFCQTDTIISNQPNLLDDLSKTELPVQLLPENMILTQRMMWGEKGLMKVSGNLTFHGVTNPISFTA